MEKEAANKVRRIISKNTVLLGWKRRWSQPEPWWCQYRRRTNEDVQVCVGTDTDTRTFPQLRPWGGSRCNDTSVAASTARGQIGVSKCRSPMTPAGLFEEVANSRAVQGNFKVSPKHLAWLKMRTGSRKERAGAAKRPRELPGARTRAI